MGGVFRATGCWPGRSEPRRRGDAPAAPGGVALRHLRPGCPSLPPWPPPLRQTGGTPWDPAAPGPLPSSCFAAWSWW